MEFEAIVSSLDAEALARVSEALLRLLSDGSGRTAPTGAALSAGEVPFAADGGAGAASAAAPAALPGARPEAEALASLSTVSRAESAAEITRLSERLDAVSEGNRRALAGAEEGTGNAAGGALPFSAPAGPARFQPQRPASAGDTEAENGSPRQSADWLAMTGNDMETVSEFFRRDSRRYDSGSSDGREAFL